MRAMHPHPGRAVILVHMPEPSSASEPPWLVFGLSGQVGTALLTALEPADPPLLALSRTPRMGDGRLRWMVGDLGSPPPLPREVRGIASLGPLDAFVDWFERSPLRPETVVALGSTSVHGKRDSPEPGEVALAGTLARCEERLVRAGERGGSRVTVLRPTLIYGNGRDRNLSRIVALARRWRFVPLPPSATGRRQPVHVADVAAAILACLRDPAAGGGLFDLPGGEVVAFDEMVRRTLHAAVPGARVVPVPRPVFLAAVRLLRRAGRLDGAGEGMLSRLDRDLTYDAAPACAALGHAPRAFEPAADMFPP